MSDKQKQIEEMARIIAFDLCPNGKMHEKWGEEAQCYSDNNFAECTKIKNLVDKLYNAGYRKIPKLGVVLLFDHYDNLLKTDKQIRKETAEKFAERLKEHFAKNSSCYMYSDDEFIPTQTVDEIYGTLDEIAKEFTGDKV